MLEPYTVSSGSIEVGDLCVRLLADGDAIIRMHRNGKVWEPETRAIWSANSTLRKDQWVLDIGAYTGVYGIAAAMMGCKVLAFEPHPANYARIHINASLNGVEEQVTVYHAAVSDRGGVRPLASKSPTHLSDTASLGGISDDGLLVQVICIDDLELDAIEAKICAMKIDVEGHELLALMGAKRTISEHQPNIIVEALTETAHSEVQSFMAMVNYRAVALLDGRNCLYVPRQL